MDELQARFRSHRSLQTDRNLAKQPYPEFEYSDDDQRQGEANVVELPSRQVHETASDPSPVQHVTAKRKQSAVKRKPATANQKAFPFRQMRDGHQQPYIDELKRLEAQAERINQLLAERKRKKAQAEQAELTNGASLPTASAPKKKAAKGSRQTPRSPQEVSPMPAQDDDTEALEAQAERIKQLLQELETALVAGEALQPDDAIAPEHVENQSQTQTSASTTQRATAAGVEPFASGTYRYGAKAQPFAEQPTPGTDQKAQQEATETAQALRYLASRDISRDRGRHPMNPTIAASRQSASRQSGARSRPPQTVQGLPSIRRYGLQLRQFLQIPQKSFDKVGDAVLWIVLAAAIRVGARFLLALFPALSPLFVLLLFAPAALAVYLAMFVPKAGFVSIYRLFLIMLGLLLGGRL